MTRSRLVADVSVAVAVGVLLAIVALRFPFGLIPGDAFTYLAAGERLNAGHPLYAISPGDRPIGVVPPYWTVPLLTPPIIGVVWRLPAALLGELAVGIWWLLHIASVTTAFVLVARRRPIVASAALLLLAFPFAYELSVANLNGFILLGLVLTRNPFGFTAFLGLISLSGVVVRNAIILIEYTEERRAEGVPLEEAVLEAGSRRLRPIFLTSVASSVGVLPMVTSGSAMWAPMGSVIALGILCSMVFTLVFVPVLYVLAHRKSDARARAFPRPMQATWSGSPKRASTRSARALRARQRRCGAAFLERLQPIRTQSWMHCPRC